MNVSSVGLSSAVQPATFTLEIDRAVTQLRFIRERSLERRRMLNRPPKLPSRQALREIVESLSAVLFPNRLGPPDLTDEGLDYFVGHLLDVALRRLQEQIHWELQFAARDEFDSAVHREQAADLVRRFCEQLPQIRSLLDMDILAAFEGDPAARSIDEVLVCYPGITAMIHHRFAHALYRLGSPLVARMIAVTAQSTTGIDIHPGATIQGGFFIDHGTGVVIGETAEIGARVRIYQAVTLGARRFPLNENGTIAKGKPRHPIIEDDVVIYAGATILGRITIGKASTIGGNVWLTRSVPPGSHITQAQVRHEQFGDGNGI